MLRLNLVLVLALGISANALAASADERAQVAAETRQGLLKVVVNYFGPIVAMAREQIPYDEAVVRSNATKISTLLPLIPDVFRRDTRGFDLETEALDNIWEEREEFEGKASTAAQRAADLARAVDDGQGAAMQAFADLGAACKACHDNFRQQK